MKIENAIGWCDETGNKVTGCDKVSPGCKNCYAQVGTRARVLRAQGIETWGSKGQRYPVKDFAAKVRRLNKLCVCDYCHKSAPINRLGLTCHDGLGVGCLGLLRRIRLFADSNSDWLNDKWPIETLADLLKDIHDSPNIDHLLLTKRAENFFERAKAVLLSITDGTGKDGLFWQMLCDWIGGKPPANVWIGVSVEDQKRADERIPLLLQIPAKVMFLSVEPLLEAVKLNLNGINYDHNLAGSYLPTPYISWAIVGGESGKDRRDCGVEAIEDVARQCVVAGVPCFVKQDCAFKPGQKGRIPDDVWALKQFPKS